MIIEHSAHSTPLPFGIRTWLWRYTCLLLLISMLWHRQAIFESKGDKLSSSAESRIRTHQGLKHQIASRPNARWQTDWAIEDQAKNLNSTARPYDQRAFSPLDPTAVWIHTYIHTYIHTRIHTVCAICKCSLQLYQLAVRYFKSYQSSLTSKSVHASVQVNVQVALPKIQPNSDICWFCQVNHSVTRCTTAYS